MEPEHTEVTAVRVVLDPEDTALLRQLLTVEKLRAPDVIRRALREYAKKLLSDTAQSKVA